LNFQCPSYFDKSKIISLKIKVVKYCIINQNLFWKDPNGIFLKCIDQEESNFIMNNLHKGACGGHQHWKATTFKILRAGYYWPTLFSDVFAKIRACE
jgi:hypothetical protein